MTSTRKG
jgi:serine/threonine protein kinase